VPLPDAAPESGFARTVFSSDIPARVERVDHITVRYREGTSRTLLCNPTPCAVTLPYGDHEVVFTAIADAERTSTVTVHARERTVVVNHTLGQVHHSPGQAGGAGALVFGILLVSIAAGIAAAPHHDGSVMSTDEKQALGGLALGGLVSITVGGIVLAASPTTIQDGATHQWNPPPQKVAGGSLGFKF
jgi:hypothetical protein